VSANQWAYLKLRGTFPPLDLLAICLVQAMVAFCCNDNGWNVVCSLFQSESWWFFCFASPVLAQKISGHRSRSHHYFCIFNIHHE